MGTVVHVVHVGGRFIRRYTSPFRDAPASNNSEETSTVAKHPRIPITLPEDTYRVIAKLAELQRRPRSAICSELLAEMTPALERITSMLELAMKNRSKLPGDTAQRLQSLEELLGATATFGLDRLEQAVTLPTPAASGKAPAGASRSRRKRH